jgi:uncharacterized protein (DUF1697 family)
MASSPSVVYVAFLRGINVGGNNMVSMKDLKARFERLGFDEVSTYINSGNILFRSTEADPRRVEEKIDRMLTREFGLNGNTVVRSHAEMAKLLKTIAKTWPTSHPDSRYNVVFLRQKIDSKGAVVDFDAKPEIERVVYCPGTLLWSARMDGLPQGAREKLMRRPIFKDATIRNLNTTTKVFALMERMAG